MGNEKNRPEQGHSSGWVSQFKSIFSKERADEAELSQLEDFDLEKPGSSLAAPAATGFEDSPAWQVAQSYHELKRSGLSAEKLREFRQVSAQEVLRQAARVLGWVSQPQELRYGSAEMVPPDSSGELALEETLEESPEYLLANPFGGDLIYEYRAMQPWQMIVVVDTSLSMNGPKLAITAVALGVLLLQFHQHRLGIVAFENDVRTLLIPGVPEPPLRVIERFLDVPGKGYTHLEGGLAEALRLEKEGRALRSVTLLLTDGKFTAGKDPTNLAHQFQDLRVLKTGRDRASYDFCMRLAKAGHGELIEVREIEDLPRLMYGVVRGLFRRRFRG